MSNEKSGLNSLGYMGAEAVAPPEVVVNHRNPVTNDLNYPIGSLWITKPAEDVYMLLSVDQEVAVWELLFSASSAGTSTFPCDTGTATQSGSVINIVGDTNIDTSGSGNTVQTVLSNGSNGQVLLGGGPTAVWKTITSADNTIIYTPGVNTLNLEVSSAIASSFPTDSGTATPTLGVVTIHGSGDVTTVGSGNTITINMTNDIIIPGTITIDSLGRGVVQSTSIGLLFSSEGTNGQILISSSSGAPAWGNITSALGTIIVTNGSNTINLEVSGGGTPSSEAFLAIQPVTVSGAASAGTPYPLGSKSVMTEIIDVNNNVYPGSGVGAAATFTAPISGKYYLKASFSITGTSGNNVLIQILTSNRSYSLFFNSTFQSNESGGRLVWQQYAVADMDAGDIATFNTQSNSTGINVLAPDTSMSGFFIC